MMLIPCVGLEDEVRECRDAGNNGNGNDEASGSSRACCDLMLQNDALPGNRCQVYVRIPQVHEQLLVLQSFRLSLHGVPRCSGFVTIRLGSSQVRFSIYL